MYRTEGAANRRVDEVYAKDRSLPLGAGHSAPGRARVRAPVGDHPAELAIVAEGTGTDTEHRVIAVLLALKDAPDDVLVDQVQAIGASQQPP